MKEQITDQVTEKVVSGLGTSYLEAYRLLFDELEKDVLQLEVNEDEKYKKYLRIFAKVYHNKHEELWLNNAVALILTQARTSSEYKHLFSKAKL